MTAGDGLRLPIKNEDVADDAAVDESKLDFNEISGHDHDGAASKKVDASNIVNTPAGTIAATDVQAAIVELDSDATLIRNDIDYPTAVKQKAIIDTGEDGGVEGGVFNGNFEYGSGSKTGSGWIGNEKYGWYVSQDAGVITASYDNSGYSGKQCIKCVTNAAGVGWIGTSPTIAHGLYKWKINVINDNSTQYRLSGIVKCDNIEATKHISAVVMGIATDWSATNLSTAEIATGTMDWTYFEVDFVIPATYVNGIRMHFKTNDNINVSTFWIDDIKLEQIDTQAVNTQTDEIVSVSVEGVTTTNNIDQYLETSGNTYTLTTGIDEGATHRQTFTPAADRDDGKHILTKIQALVAAIGTGDWTLVVHDAANNVLASKTIVNGSMSIGDIDFNVPAILDVGTAYHFHIYSTVADGTVTTTDNADLETVDYHAQFTKHTESPIIKSNDSTLDMTGIKLSTGATITVNADGSGKYAYDQSAGDLRDNLTVFYDIHSIVGDRMQYIHGSGEWTFVLSQTAGETTDLIWKFKSKYLFKKYNNLTIYGIIDEATRYWSLLYSFDNVNWQYILNNVDNVISTNEIYNIPDAEGHSVIFIKASHESGGNKYITGIRFESDFDCQAALPIFTPSTEVTTETSDLTLNPIDISEDKYWQLNSDLTGWGSRTFSMLASEAAFESQAVSANYIYMYDSNGTIPWTWDERSGLVPPADRTSGTVTAKFLVSDNQIRSSVNDGSMKANVNLSWNEESLRAAINRLTALANLQYPIVIEVEDVPAIDLQDQPTGASAETGYTNDVTSLRQTAAATPAITYTGLLPRENQFSEWLDITIVCSDGDGTLQGKLYTVDGTLIETYADLESNPVIEISNPDYKYSRERLILQISASLETTGTAWSVTDIKWRYQYNGV